MRIPASVIVMGLVTATPFGLAVRDELKQRQAEREAKAAAKRAAELEQQRELAEQQAREAAERKAAEEAKRMHTVFDTVIGDQPATPGPAIAPVFEGKEPAASPDFDVNHEERFGKLSTVEVMFHMPSCDQLDEWLQARWGEIAYSYWLDPANHRRAFRDAGECAISFETYATPEQWVGPTRDAIVPVGAVGKPAAELRAQVDALGVHDYDESEGEGFRWEDLGIGIDGTQLRVYTDGGKVAKLHVEVTASDEARAGVVERLTKLYGPPVEDDYGFPTWPKKKLTVDWDETSLRLDAGELP